ncbi:hypothetical protein [Chondrinema litorale]|nr:hypothetical protein [Chondrinema litorale]UZS00279.1 hypothetical protein OQ292_40775 [Chondrinema litorale]
MKLSKTQISNMKTTAYWSALFVLAAVGFVAIIQKAINYFL